MKVIYHRIAVFFGLCFFLFSPAFLAAEDRRGIPLDLCLIVDGSALFEDGKNEAVNWISRELIDGILQEGDSVTVWSAGSSARVLYSEKIGAAKDSIKNLFKNLETSAGSADFSGAVREAASRLGRESGNLGVTMVVSGSATALAPSLGGQGSLFRWSKVDEYSGWQVLVVAPGIGEKVARASAAYMSSL